MNLIMSKTRNSLNSINVDKLTFTHINERDMHRSKKKKNKQLFDEIDENINEEYLCQMKNKLLDQNTILFESQNAFEFFKKSVSQQLTDDATKK